MFEWYLTKAYVVAKICPSYSSIWRSIALGMHIVAIAEEKILSCSALICNPFSGLKHLKDTDKRVEFVTSKVKAGFHESIFIHTSTAPGSWQRFNSHSSQVWLRDRLSPHYFLAEHAWKLSVAMEAGLNAKMRFTPSAKGFHVAIFTYSNMRTFTSMPPQNIPPAYCSVRIKKGLKELADHLSINVGTQQCHEGEISFEAVKSQINLCKDWRKYRK